MNQALTFVSQMYQIKVRFERKTKKAMPKRVVGDVHHVVTEMSGVGGH